MSERANVTAGSKCAAEIGANAQIRTKRPACGDRIGKQRNRSVTVRKPLAHDARADHNRQQEREELQLEIFTRQHRVEAIAAAIVDVAIQACRETESSPQSP